MSLFTYIAAFKRCMDLEQYARASTQLSKNHNTTETAIVAGPLRRIRSPEQRLNSFAWTRHSQLMYSSRLRDSFDFGYNFVTRSVVDSADFVYRSQLAQQ
jgi:hypothetical protein